MNEAYQRQAEIRAKCFHPTGQWEEFKPEDLNQSIVSRFEQMVARYPDRLALKCGDEMLTYAELNRAANRLAQGIIERCGTVAEPVLFLTAQGVQAMVTMLGILKAGKFYVALETTYPSSRLIQIVEDCQARLIITNQQALLQAQELIANQATIGLLNLNTLSPNLPDHNLGVAIALDAFSCLVYTSGTTGTPKGVIETHRNVLRFTRILTNIHHLCNDDRIGLNQTNSFSGTALKIYPALLNGALLCIFDFNQMQIINLANWLANDQITYLHCVPSLLRQLVQTLTPNQVFRHLRVLSLGGDRILTSDIIACQKHFMAPIVFRVGLGISEIQSFLFYFYEHNTKFPNQLIPAGYCVEDVTVFLVDEQGQAVSNGEIGEMVVKSRYVSPGYWRQPALTEARFRPDPQGSDDRLFYTGDLGMRLDDGCLFHMGRKDMQVKVKGVRIEVAEIEHVLWETGWFETVVVVACPDHMGEQRLVAYVVPAQHPAPSIGQIRRAASVKLPPAMVPSAYVLLAALPLNANGKVDVKALPDPSTICPNQDTAYMAARNDVEAAIIDIWQEVLGITPIGIHDHFLDLGGDSLQATQIVGRMLNQLNTIISPRVLMLQPTIAKMALAMVQYQAKLVDSEMLESLLIKIENHE